MAVLRFTTSRLSELRAAGRLDELQHATIAPFLERELGARYGRLFADFEAESRDLRAWYADVDTAPRPIGALLEAEQEALRRQVAEMIGTITDFATRMATESTQKANLARILTAATTFPIEDLWLAGDQPIIVNWGFHRHNAPPGVPRPILERIERTPAGGQQPPRTDTFSRRPPSAEAVAIAPRPVSSFRPWVIMPALLWLLFVLLVGGSYRLLLPACGLRWPILSSLSLLDACDVTATSEDLAAEGSELQRAVDEAELDLRRQKTLCVPEQRRAEVTPPRAPDRPAEPPGRVERKAPPPRVADIERKVERAMPREAPRGKVEVSLLWNNNADLDLIIDCPGNDTLWRKNLEACGGKLLRDVIPSGTNPNETQIEHAAWASSPHGRFKIKVELYSYASVPADTDIPFTIRIKRGETAEIVEGHVKGSHTTVTATATDL